MKQPAKPQQSNFAQCWQCKGRFAKSQIKIVEKPAGKDVEVGFHCPNPDCNIWVHYFFMNAELKTLLEARTKPGGNNRQARRAYEAKFRKFNDKKRKAEGMKLINNRWYKPEAA